jgi:hypothetical protein
MAKWIITLIVTCFLVINAQAKAAYCGYKDYFRLHDTQHRAIAILKGFSDSDVLLQMLGPHSFVIRDSYQCQSGYVHVTIADIYYSSDNWCVLNIKDGPFLNHPVVTPLCQGIHYINTEYDGFNTYSYTINLD